MHPDMTWFGRVGVSRPPGSSMASISVCYSCIPRAANGAKRECALWGTGSTCDQPDQTNERYLRTSHVFDTVSRYVIESCRRTQAEKK
eukprot:6910628-Prymnesium_polylepis.4